MTTVYDEAVFNDRKPKASKQAMDKRLNVVRKGIRRPRRSEIDPRKGTVTSKASVERAAGILIHISEICLLLTSHNAK